RIRMDMMERFSPPGVEKYLIPIKLVLLTRRYHKLLLSSFAIIASGKASLLKPSIFIGKHYKFHNAYCFGGNNHVQKSMIGKGTFNDHRLHTGQQPRSQCRVSNRCLTTRGLRKNFPRGINGAFQRAPGAPAVPPNAKKRRCTRYLEAGSHGPVSQ